MNRLFLSTGIFILSLAFIFGAAEYAHAASAASPNSTTSTINFRRPEGFNIRYQRNKRSISRRQSADYNTSSGTLSTFDRRADVLRAAQLLRIQEDLDQRKYSGVRRTSSHFWDRSNRSGPTTIRRINEADKNGGIRHGQPKRENQRTQNEKQRKRALQQEYRTYIRDRERAFIDATEANNASECGGLLGRRYAKCLYKLQNK